MSAFRPRAALLALACALLFALPLSADGGVLVPLEVYVGDTAEFSFVTNALGDALIPGTVQVIPRDSLPSSPLVTVESILITAREDGALVVIRFVPWAAGQVQLPPFVWGKARVAPPSVRISSALERTGISEMAPPRSPLLIPGTAWLLYGLIGAVLAASFVFALGFLRLRRYLRSSPFRRESAFRMRILARDLRRLDRGLRKLPIPLWYASYAAALRRYAGSLCLGDPSALVSATASELVGAISARLSDPCADDVRAELLGSIRGLLIGVDETRFSGQVCGDTRAGDIETLRALADSLEAVVASLPEAGESDSPSLMSRDDPREDEPV